MEWMLLIFGVALLLHGVGMVWLACSGAVLGKVRGEKREVRSPEALVEIVDVTGRSYYIRPSLVHKIAPDFKKPDCHLIWLQDEHGIAVLTEGLEEVVERLNGGER